MVLSQTIALICLILFSAIRLKIFGVFKLILFLSTGHRFTQPQLKLKVFFISIRRLPVQ